MRIVIQRVVEASVTIEGKVKGKIGCGLLVLLGIESEDTQEDIDWLVGKIARLRIFADSEDKMNLSLSDVEGEVLVISQFTLHASTKKGNRPSYIRSAPPRSRRAALRSICSYLGANPRQNCRNRNLRCRYESCPHQRRPRHHLHRLQTPRIIGVKPNY
jgi:D-tyrosyl-tRNA(Tyr) deacylase